MRIRSIAALSLSTILAASLALPTYALADAKSDFDAANAAASEASSAYDEAVAKQEELAADIQAKTDELATLEEVELPAAKQRYDNAVRQMYVGGSDFAQVVAMVLTGTSLSDVISMLNAYENITEWRMSAVEELRDTREEIKETKALLEEDKVAQDSAVEEASAKKQEALDARDAARKAYQATLPQNIPTTRRAPTSTSFWDEDSARAFIVMKESGGNYNARNGRYVGAYQLTNTYLNGDYSPENQDRVAEQYVRGRYGSWMNAANFWVTHHWY